jgi:hypothetical protein
MLRTFDFVHLPREARVGQALEVSVLAEAAE